MKQNSYCTEVGVLPGTDFRVQPKYMDMLNLQEAWQFGRGAGQKVAVIDTGVTPHPRFQHLIAGGDYVMAGGDGLSDCDAHGTIVASMIGAAPASGAAGAAGGPAQAGDHSDHRAAAESAAATDGDAVAATADRDDGSARPRRRSTASVRSAATTTARRHRRPPSPASQAPGPPPAPGRGQPRRRHGHYSHWALRRRAGDRGRQSDRAAPAGSDAQTATATAAATRRHRVGPADAYSGIAPDVDIISIRQSSQAFGLKDAYTGDEDPQTPAEDRQHSDDGAGDRARRQHGRPVINISDVTCMSARNIIDQRALGAAVRYAAVDKNAVIVAAAGDSSKKDCKQNPPLIRCSPTILATGTRSPRW